MSEFTFSLLESQNFAVTYLVKKARYRVTFLVKYTCFNMLFIIFEYQRFFFISFLAIFSMFQSNLQGVLHNK